MPINWKSPEVMDRLLTAMLAAVDNKVNINEIARLYGADMTYNALENHLRKFKKEALTMKAQAEGTTAPAPSPARHKGTKTVPSTPSRKGVASGRVSKKSTPKSKVKFEDVDEELIFGKGKGKHVEDSDENLGEEDDQDVEV